MTSSFWVILLRDRKKNRQKTLAEVKMREGLCLQHAHDYRSDALSSKNGKYRHRFIRFWLQINLYNFMGT